MFITHSSLNIDDNSSRFEMISVSELSQVEWLASNDGEMCINGARKITLDYLILITKHDRANKSAVTMAKDFFRWIMIRRCLQQRIPIERVLERFPISAEVGSEKLSIAHNHHHHHLARAVAIMCSCLLSSADYAAMNFFSQKWKTA